jgi:hypothetical protein
MSALAISAIYYYKYATIVSAASLYYPIATIIAAGACGSMMCFVTSGNRTSIRNKLNLKVRGI